MDNHTKKDAVTRGDKILVWLTLLVLLLGGVLSLMVVFLVDSVMSSM